MYTSPQIRNPDSGELNYAAIWQRAADQAREVAALRYPPEDKDRRECEEIRLKFKFYLDMMNKP